MIQVYLTFLTAIALSAIAGFYSIIGLAQIFPGSFWPIVLMGSILEIAKLVTISWLYNNWKNAGTLLKTYFSIAILVLMMITSMGIFGYLSKAHLESNIVLGANTVQLRTLETQEKITKDRLDYLLKQASDPEKTSSRVDRDIRNAQADLKKLTEQKLPLLSEENKLAAEIGPIKYIAELFYDKNDPSFIDKAVRAVIITIIIVFDPLAVLLLIAAQKTYKVTTRNTTKSTKKSKKKQVDHVIELDEDEELVIQYNEEEKNEVIPKSKITKLDGGSF
jgi:hypothetical protein